jgi:hypothetical protein
VKRLHIQRTIQAMGLALDVGFLGYLPHDYKSRPVFYPFYFRHNIAQYLETHHFGVAEV